MADPAGVAVSAPTLSEGVGVGVAASPSSTPVTLTRLLSVKVIDGNGDGDGDGWAVGSVSARRLGPYPPEWAETPVAAPIRRTARPSVARGTADFCTVALPVGMKTDRWNDRRQY